MSFKNLDVDSALARIADRKIEEAMREGKFDNLPGAGKPLELEPIPTDERAHMLWWALKLLKQNDVIPEEVTWRKQIDDLKQKLAKASNEAQIVALVMQINRLVRQLNTLGTNAIASSVGQVSLEAEIKKFHSYVDYASPISLDFLQDHALVRAIKERALGLGFDLVGIASAEPSRYRDYFRQWLDDGQAGSMAYLNKRFEERSNPAAYLHGAQSVICVAMNYYTELEPPPVADSGRLGKVARYALGDDYHELIKDRLHSLADWLREATACRTRCGVDTAPVMEKELAARAGIGWIGKNTCIINPGMGSWLLLGEILTTLALPADEIAVDHCGTCTQCIDACPTGAIVGPYYLDARRCISYLTIEHRGEITAEFHAPIGNWLYGCDICQDVCPHNRRAPVAREPGLRPRFGTGTLNVDDVLAWTEEDYRPAVKGSAMRRVKLPQGCSATLAL